MKSEVLNTHSNLHFSRKVPFFLAGKNAKIALQYQGSKNRPPSGHLRLKNPVWRVKKSFSGQFGDWKLPFSGQVGDQTFWRTTPMRTERKCARCMAVFVGPRCKGFGRSGSIDRVGEYPPPPPPSHLHPTPSPPPPHPPPHPGVWVPSLRFSFGDHLSLVERRKYHTRCDCQFARHISPLHESSSVRVWEEKVPQCMGRD